MNDTVLLEKDAGVATLTLNRPRAMNALNEEMREALVQRTAQVENDPSVRCVVLRGAGDNFMAGGDVKLFHSMLGMDAAERAQRISHFIHEMHPAMISLRRMPKPVLASVRGAAAGFGVGLLMGCDLALAGDDAFFTMAYCHLGASPDGSSTYTLPRMVGMKQAMELALLGDRFDAAAAQAYGLINRVVPAAELEAETAKLAARLAAGPGLAYAKTKALINRSLISSYEEQLQAELESFGECAMSEDFAEGVAAFVEKRKPEFKGR